MYLGTCKLEHNFNIIWVINSNNWANIWLWNPFKFARYLPYEVLYWCGTNNCGRKLKISYNINSLTYHEWLRSLPICIRATALCTSFDFSPESFSLHPVRNRCQHLEEHSEYNRCLIADRTIEYRKPTSEIII